MQCIRTAPQNKNNTLIVITALHAPVGPVSQWKISTHEIPYIVYREGNGIHTISILYLIMVLNVPNYYFDLLCIRYEMYILNLNMQNIRKHKSE